ncbi:MAG: DUF3341 domain-containing protein [Myxococcota bacterium]|nr:DUF3341 domain-containing protein [Myxococcota bacterium]
MSANVKGVFNHLDSLITAIGRVKKAGFDDYTVLSPLPRHEIEEAIYENEPSPVRWWTLIGGITGGTLGFTLASLTSAVWPMALPAGKPMISVPPFVVVTFECTVLLAGLSTLAAIIFHCRLPDTDTPIECADPRYSNDRFGLVFHDVEGARKDEAIKLLQDAGAEEVSCAADEDEATEATEVVHEES